MSKNKDKPIFINLGDAKIGHLQITDSGLFGDIDFVVAGAPEIKEANISRPKPEFTRPKRNLKSKPKPKLETRNQSKLRPKLEIFETRIQN